MSTNMIYFYSRVGFPILSCNCNILKPFCWRGVLHRVMTWVRRRLPAAGLVLIVVVVVMVMTWKLRSHCIDAGGTGQTDVDSDVRDWMNRDATAYKIYFACIFEWYKIEDSCNGSLKFVTIFVYISFKMPCSHK